MISIDLFRHEGSSQSFPRGSVVFAEGDRGDTMYVVLEGSVDLLIRGTTVESLGPGGLFGEMTMIDGSPRVATAIARTDSKLVPIDERRFNFLVQQTPHFALQVMRILADRLRRMDEKL